MKKIKLTRGKFALVSRKTEDMIPTIKEALRQQAVAVIVSHVAWEIV